MSIANAFQSLKAHVTSLMVAAATGIKVEEQHLQSLFTKVEDLGKHIAQGDRTILSLDLGHIAEADARELIEKVLAIHSIKAIVTEIKSVFDPIPAAAAEPATTVTVDPATTSASASASAGGVDLSSGN